MTRNNCNIYYRKSKKTWYNINTECCGLIKNSTEIMNVEMAIPVKNSKLTEDQIKDWVKITNKTGHPCTYDGIHKKSSVELFNGNGKKTSKNCYIITIDNSKTIDAKHTLATYSILRFLYGYRYAGLVDSYYRIYRQFKASKETKKLKDLEFKALQVAMWDPNIKGYSGYYSLIGRESFPALITTVKKYHKITKEHPKLPINSRFKLNNVIKGIEVNKHTGYAELTGSSGQKARDIKKAINKAFTKKNYIKVLNILRGKDEINK